MRKLYTRRKQKYTHSPWWGQDSMQGLKWDMRTVSSEKWKHTYCMSAIKHASLYLPKKSLYFCWGLRIIYRVFLIQQLFPSYTTFICKDASSLLVKTFSSLSWASGCSKQGLPHRRGEVGTSRAGSHWLGPTVCESQAELDQHMWSGSDTAQRWPDTSPAPGWVRGQARKSVSSSGSRHGKKKSGNKTQSASNQFLHTRKATCR